MAERRLLFRDHNPHVAPSIHQGTTEMKTIRTAPFGDLFLTTFLVAASFQIAVSILGVILAFTSPGLFNMNGVPATSPTGAIGVLVFLLVVGLVVNAGMSALGALIVMGWRGLLPKPKD